MARRACALLHGLMGIQRNFFHDKQVAIRAQVRIAFRDQAGVSRAVTKAACLCVRQGYASTVDLKNLVVNAQSFLLRVSDEGVAPQAQPLLIGNQEAVIARAVGAVAQRAVGKHGLVMDKGLAHDRSRMAAFLKTKRHLLRLCRAVSGYRMTCLAFLVLGRLVHKRSLLLWLNACPRAGSVA